MILVDDSGLEHLHGCRLPVGFGADHQIQIGLLRTRIAIGCGYGDLANDSLDNRDLLSRSSSALSSATEPSST
jgi:hypothetical protein